MKKKELIAMLLAGGQGSRLNALTSNNAKPAVSFGGKYRIIDFTLSNCSISGIDTVGVLVQYRPTHLSHYLGTGGAWDLDTQDGGVYVLPPYATQEGGAWYEGTADSIYHNIDFIDSYNPENVLVLSGDHLYKFDYNNMLKVHKERNADLTVSVLEVPIEEASRFGIMTCDENDNIVKFTEKPANPDSNLASMGIYIFSWKALKDALLRDHVDPNSAHDFGNNIIPMLLKDKKVVTVYRYSGYWKDVGTIDSYYEAQMNLLRPTEEFSLFDDTIKMFANSSDHVPHFVGPTGDVKDSIVCNGCGIDGKVEHSILSSGARVEEGAIVRDSILLPNCVVKSGCELVRAIVGEDDVVKAGSICGKLTGPIELVAGDHPAIEKE